jgi:hypothetical protein
VRRDKVGVIGLPENCKNNLVILRDFPVTGNKRTCKLNENRRKVSHSAKRNGSLYRGGDHPSVRGDSKVEQIISSPEKQPHPHRKKRKPFLPLNGRDLRKARTNDVDKGKEDPQSCMRMLLHNEDSETTYLFSTYKKKTISFPGAPHHVILVLQL